MQGEINVSTTTRLMLLACIVIFAIVSVILAMTKPASALLANLALFGLCMIDVKISKTESLLVGHTLKSLRYIRYCAIAVSVLLLVNSLIYLYEALLNV